MGSSWQDPLVYRDATRLHVQGLAKFFDSPVHSDITIVLPNGCNRQCHRLLLAACSPRLAGILAGNSNSRHMPMAGADSNALDRIIRFMYTGDCELSPDTVIPTYDAAIKLDIASLIVACKQYLQQTARPPLVAGMLNQAAACQQEVILNHVLEATSDSYRGVVGDVSFHQLSEHAFAAFLKHHHHRMLPLEQLLDAANSWCSADNARVTFVQQLLSGHLGIGNQNSTTTQLGTPTTPVAVSRPQPKLMIITADEQSPSVMSGSAAAPMSPSGVGMQQPQQQQQQQQQQVPAMLYPALPMQQQGQQQWQQQQQQQLPVLPVGPADLPLSSALLQHHLQQHQQQQQRQQQLIADMPVPASVVLPTPHAMTPAVTAAAEQVAQGQQLQQYEQQQQQWQQQQQPGQNMPSKTITVHLPDGQSVMAVLQEGSGVPAGTVLATPVGTDTPALNAGTAANPHMTQAAAALSGMHMALSPRVASSPTATGHTMHINTQGQSLGQLSLLQSSAVIQQVPTPLSQQEQQQQRLNQQQQQQQQHQHQQHLHQQQKPQQQQQQQKQKQQQEEVKAIPELSSQHNIPSAQAVQQQGVLQASDTRIATGANGPVASADVNDQAGGTAPSSGQGLQDMTASLQQHPTSHPCHGIAGTDNTAAGHLITQTGTGYIGSTAEASTHTPADGALRSRSKVGLERPCALRCTAQLPCTDPTSDRPATDRPAIDSKPESCEQSMAQTSADGTTRTASVQKGTSATSSATTTAGKQQGSTLIQISAQHASEVEQKLALQLNTTPITGTTSIAATTPDTASATIPAATMLPATELPATTAATTAAATAAATATTAATAAAAATTPRMSAFVGANVATMSELPPAGVIASTANSTGSPSAAAALPSPSTRKGFQKEREGRSQSGAGMNIGVNGGPAPCRNVCNIDNCYADLTGLKDYHQRFRICDYHLKLSCILCDGHPQRFCQQCGRFHHLSEFDGNKRSCRARLQQHNMRRRKRLEAEKGGEDNAAGDMISPRGPRGLQRQLPATFHTNVLLDSPFTGPQQPYVQPPLKRSKSEAGAATTPTAGAAATFMGHASPAINGTAVPGNTNSNMNGSVGLTVPPPGPSPVVYVSALPGLNSNGDSLPLGTAGSPVVPLTSCAPAGTPQWVVLPHAGTTSQVAPPYIPVPPPAAAPAQHFSAQTAAASCQLPNGVIMPWSGPPPLQQHSPGMPGHASGMQHGMQQGMQQGLQHGMDFTPTGSNLVVSNAGVNLAGANTMQAGGGQPIIMMLGSTAAGVATGGNGMQGPL